MTIMQKIRKLREDVARQEGVEKSLRSRINTLENLVEVKDARILALREEVSSLSRQVFSEEW